MKRIVFLYTELAEYFLACIQELEKTDSEIHIFRWPANTEAPFQFRNLHKTRVYDRDRLTQQVITEINPDIIFCSGWTDKDYLSICKKWKKKIPTILLLDNPWKGTWKQRLAGVLAPFVLQTKFSGAWVPGKQQQIFAQKLSFTTSEIRMGFYCADVNTFQSWYQKFKEAKNVAYPKRFLYVGRYIDFKGVKELWQVFADLSKKHEEWELWCAGTGPLWNSRLLHPKIKHLGFVQPMELGELVGQSGVFILPSHKEPWGVVVQEMCAAGLPLLCSDQVGANSQFLVEGTNGFSFKSEELNSLNIAMENMMRKSDTELRMMSEASSKLAATNTPEKWVQTLYSFF